MRAMAVAALLAAACGSVHKSDGQDPGAGGPDAGAGGQDAGAGDQDAGAGPVAITAVSGDGQSGTASAPLAQPFVVEATQDGHPLAGATVDFVVVAGGGTMSAATVMTDAQGLAGSTLTLGSALGTNTVRAQLAGAAAAPVAFSATCQPGAAKKLVLVSGDRQSVRFGVQTQPLVVMVQDDAGNPVPGFTVAFNVTAGGGALTTASVMSDGDGLAAARWFVGGPTTNTVEASGAGLVGSPVVFSASVSAFAAAQPFSQGNSTTGVVTGDLNVDGRPDVVLASQNAAGLGATIVLRNSTAVGGTTVNLPSVGSLAAAGQPDVAVIGDINGDGKADLVTASQTGLSAGVFLNTTPSGSSNPSFAARADVDFGPVVVLALADINGDGKPDLVGNLAATDAFSVAINTTATGAATASFGGRVGFQGACGLGAPTGITIDDVNGDGRPDVLIACGNLADTGIRGPVSVFLNTTPTGAAVPSFAPRKPFTVLNLVSIATGDINHDGRPDIAVANKAASSVTVLLNTTTAGGITAAFADPVDVPTGLAPVAVIAMDLNGDGKPDLATANKASQSLSVMANLTDAGAAAPRFASKIDIPLSVVPTALTAADLNNDGKLDLIVVGSTDVLVFVGQ